MTADRNDNTPPEVTAASQVARLFAWRRGFNAMHLIDLGVRLGLFKAFAETPDVTAGHVADRLGLHAPYVEVWCTTAYSFELLEADAERRFRLAPFVHEILGNPAHPRYLGGYVRLGTAFATEDYRRAPEAFRTGSTVAFQGRSDDFARTVAEAIAGMNRVVARRILLSLAGVAEQLTQGGAILEVGGGTGNLLLQLAQAFPHSRCMGVDIDPTGLAAARAAVHQAGLAERVQLLEGAVSHAVLPEAYDVVVMVEVLHEIAPTLRPGVIQGCARALRAGGWLVIVDETYPATLGEARYPEFLFPVQTGFEELLWGNVVPTKAEQEQLLRAAGLTGAINRSLMGEGFTLLTTQK